MLRGDRGKGCVFIVCAENAAEIGGAGSIGGKLLPVKREMKEGF